MPRSWPRGSAAAWAAVNSQRPARPAGPATAGSIATTCTLPTASRSCPCASRGSITTISPWSPGRSDAARPPVSDWLSVIRVTLVLSAAGAPPQWLSCRQPEQRQNGSRPGPPRRAGRVRPVVARPEPVHGGGLGIFRELFPSARVPWAARPPGPRSCLVPSAHYGVVEERRKPHCCRGPATLRAPAVRSDCPPPLALRGGLAWRWASCRSAWQFSS